MVRRAGRPPQRSGMTERGSPPGEECPRLEMSDRPALSGWTPAEAEPGREETGQGQAAPGGSLGPVRLCSGQEPGGESEQQGDR